MTRKHLKLLVVALILYWLLIFTLTHLPPKDVPQVHLSDKIEHLGAFSCLAFLVNNLLHARKSRRADVLTLVIVLVYGAIDEWSQIPVGRTCDLQDWFADGTGAALGTIAACLFRMAYHRLFPTSAPTQPKVQDTAAQ